MENKTHHVLIADDRDNWRRVLRYLSEKEGFFVSEAKDIEEAQKELEQKNIDLAMIDVRFIDKDVFNVDGLDLLHFIKDKYPKTKVIVLTAYPESIGNQKPKEADDVIFKIPSKEMNLNKEIRSKIIKLFPKNSENGD